MTTLKQDYNTLSKLGRLNKVTPEFIIDNLNPAFALREYQKEAIARFIDYFYILKVNYVKEVVEVKTLKVGKYVILDGEASKERDSK